MMNHTSNKETEKVKRYDPKPQPKVEREPNSQGKINRIVFEALKPFHRAELIWR
jgi:hypothetical protein